MLVDAHCRLDGQIPGAGDALAAVRTRRIVTLAVSADPDSYRSTLAVAGGEPLVLPALGLHPARAAAWEARLDEVVSAAEGAPQIGEIGLDSPADDATGYAAQARALAALLDVAARRDVPVHLVVSGAEEALADAVERHGVRRAVVHAYRGPVSSFRRLVDLGCRFSVGCDVLDSEAARRVAREIPADRLFTSTGAGGGPDRLAEVVREVAQLRGLRARDVRSLVWRNVRRLYDGCAELEAALEEARTG